MDEPKLIAELRENIAVLTINRERRRNALDNDTLFLIRDALASYKQSAVRAIVLTGSGTRAFCAGSDLKAMAALDLDGRLAHTELGQAVMDMIEEHPCPVIAAIEGFCLGGGLEIALACDYRVAGRSTTVGLPEVTINALPTWGGTQRLPRMIGLSRAREVVLFGRRLTADEALAWGIFNKVVEDGATVASAIEVANLVIQGSARRTVSIAKQIVNFGYGTPNRTGRQLEYLADVIQMSSPDLEASVAGFIGKKK